MVLPLSSMIGDKLRVRISESFLRLLALHSIIIGSLFLKT